MTEATASVPMSATVCVFAPSHKQARMQKGNKG
eukprot:CAMPEP_0203897950 /NCGR_PEP_ID=MMETSP0359-20131031/40538_1 /ASSEMBLY_ACC=CAM_ASM_000338 /TAXON_ID=268821 /ORGANISM="Scrippsiella Hangoei, Strain SHTV-5" /LENGTH=32 /DNA_ID= /DNA_START= /DNA_END= /DNA_ORIENTATION=